MARPRTGHSRARAASKGAGGSTNERIGAEIRKARQAAGLTQKELAAHLNKSRAWISAAEHGRRVIFVRDLPRLGEALGIDPLELASRALRDT